MAKQPMSIEKKTKLIYSGELLIFAVLFIVLATLRIVGVIKYNSTRIAFFNWITLVGGVWTIVDLIWCLVSKKRRKKNSLIDKIIVIPSAIYLITFDLISLINAKNNPDTFYIYGVAIVFYYLACVFAFEGIYHYYKPVPSLLAAIKEEEEELRKEQEKQKLEEQSNEQQEGNNDNK